MGWNKVIRTSAGNGGGISGYLTIYDWNNTVDSLIQNGAPSEFGANTFFIARCTDGYFLLTVLANGITLELVDILPSQFNVDNIVESVEGGFLISVNNSDPAHPVVNFGFDFAPNVEVVSTGSVIITHNLPYPPSKAILINEQGEPIEQPFSYVSDTQTRVSSKSPMTGTVYLY